MKKYLLILLVCFSFLVRAQTVITGEYFFDTDPGIGVATAVTLTANASIQNATFSAAIGSRGVWRRHRKGSPYWPKEDRLCGKAYTRDVQTRLISMNGESSGEAGHTAEYRSSCSRFTATVRVFRMRRATHRSRRTRIDDFYGT